MTSKEEKVLLKQAVYRSLMQRRDSNYSASPQQTHRRCCSWTCGQVSIPNSIKLLYLLLRYSQKLPVEEEADALSWSPATTQTRGVYRVPQRYNHSNFTTLSPNKQHAESNYSLLSNETESPCWESRIQHQQDSPSYAVPTDFSLHDPSNDKSEIMEDISITPVILTSNVTEEVVANDDCHPIEIIFPETSKLLESLPLKNDSLLQSSFTYELNPDRKQSAVATDNNASILSNAEETLSIRPQFSAVSGVDLDRSTDTTVSPRISGLMKNSIAKSYVEHLMEKNRAQKGIPLTATSKHHRNQSY